MLRKIQNKKKIYLSVYPSPLRRPDSNRRPLGYEPNELPTAPLRDIFLNSAAKVQLFSDTANISGKYLQKYAE